MIKYHPILTQAAQNIRPIIGRTSPNIPYYVGPTSLLDVGEYVGTTHGIEWADESGLRRTDHFTDLLPTILSATFERWAKASPVSPK